jgi:Co/Zn/Cd efflux system component
VLAINAAMFVVEFSAGLIAGSSALMADSLDMLGDASVYTLSLFALNRSDRWRAGAALAKAGAIVIFGAAVIIEIVFKLLYGAPPVAGLMLLFGGLALGANLTCLGLLFRYRRADVNMSSTFECSRNDVAANVGVLVAAVGVYVFGSVWPDIIVATLIAALFLRSAYRIVRDAWPQFRSGVLVRDITR